MYIKKIESLAIQTRELLQPVSLGEESKIDEHNLLSSANIDEINKICEVYVAIFGQLSTIEDTSLMEHYFENIHPLVSRLMAYKNTHVNSSKINILSELILNTNHFQIVAKE